MLLTSNYKEPTPITGVKEEGGVQGQLPGWLIHRGADHRANGMIAVIRKINCISNDYRFLT